MSEPNVAETKNLEYFKEKLDKLCEKTGINVIGILSGEEDAVLYVNGSFSIDDVKGTVHFIMDSAFDLIQEKTIKAVKRMEK